ncbi:hypothetical protein U9M48_040369 [Paspalum notatum var. saurae]|uniref:Uncharacterized protein n=1 Tax=Paspalum notatum var. saurae TaxID=547442 RepID=A0AAQ3XFH3_PASNO
MLIGPTPCLFCRTGEGWSEWYRESMEGIVTSTSNGVIDSVLAKLNELMMGDMCSNLLGVSSMGIQFLWNELSAMKALLEKLEDADELDPQAKDWRDQVREMTFDIEDCIDEFMSNEECDDAKAGFINKVSSFLKTLRSRVKTACQIKDLKTRLQEIDERHKRYKIEEYPSTSTRRIDPRLSALYNEATSLVGLANPKEELLEVMSKRQQFMVVAIVGFGGLGKTTLVNEVYREVSRQFNSKAFVSISQNPDMARVLKCILSQLEPRPYFHACEVQDLINDLREHLHDKRYIMVVDDLWDIRAWNIISCALPKNNQQSIVVITTRNEDVARECCRDHGYIYNLKPLSEQDSIKLFLNRIYRFGYVFPSENLKAVSCKILKKCGGLPLAIITVASILGFHCRNWKEQLEKIHNSLATKFATNSNFEDMMHILDLSYKNLPRHLKACFLYLGTYPEDHRISKVDLVRRWVAEGFVSHSGQDVWDVAESYFYELVNRSMIQLSYEDDDGNDMVSYCRVHDMMLELIIRRCREDNFISLIHDQQVLVEGKDKVIRRLTLNLSSVDNGTTATTTTRHLSHVRSLTIFGGSNWIPPLLQELKFLRVLFLDIYRRGTKIDLTGISQLAQLRYIKVENEKSIGEITIELPVDIQSLRFLETLELPALSVCRIPSDIVHLPRLSHLVVPHDTGLPDGIGKVKSLRSLDGFSLPTSSLENIVGLRKLTNLTDLSLHCHTESLEYVTALGCSLLKLRNLKNLSVSCTFGGSYADALAFPLISLGNLELIDLSGCTFSQIPSIWVLGQLRQLRLGARQILQEDIVMLGTKLHYLVKLHLRTAGALTERMVISGSTGFVVLKVFELESDEISYLTFEAGAMPRLQKLWLAFDPSSWDRATPAGLQHLSSLKQIYVLTVRSGCTTSRSDEAPTTSMSETAVIRSAFQEAADAHPGRPAFTLGEEWLIRAMQSWRTL